MGKIEKILKKGPVEGQTTEVYPVTSTKAVYDENNKRLDNIITGLQESVYLNTPIPISTENTTESTAQNVKNIADYVEKAKAAGIASVNGMAVTCIIDNDYSGVGYLNGDTNISICAIEIFDDSSNPKYFRVDPDGTYEEVQIIMENSVNIVTSDMLVEGARKPIILTPSTTEVDEETYQKLLSDDVDVMFKDATDVFNILYDRVISETTITLTFVSVTCSDTTNASSYVFSCFPIFINKVAPHTLQVSGPAENNLEQILNDSGYLNKSTLTPVLKKINLRKGNNSAVIKQFEADWENLNGSLYGARFIGYPAGVLPVLFMKDDFNDCYIGYTDRDLDGAPDSTGPFKKITLCANDNYNLKVTDVPATVQYIDLNSTTTNLTSIGAVQQNTPHCFTYTKGSEIIKGVGQVWQSSSYGYLEGISFDGKYRVHAEVQANGAATVTLTSIGAQKLLQPILQEIDLTGTDADRKAKLDKFEADWKALTGASDLSGARFVGKSVVPDNGTVITGVLSYDDGGNYVGLLYASGYTPYKAELTIDGSLTITPLFSHLEAITIKTNNSTASKVANVAAIKAYVDNLTALGVDTTKGFLIPINVEGQGAGFISRLSGTDSYMGIMTSYGIPTFGIAVSVAGEYYSYRFQTDSDNSLTTTSKQIVGAINEVNALAKGYSTIFTPIELTTETAQNKTAIDARVAAFTAQGISLTNGCCIPVVYKGVYAGNINLINGDWYGLLVKNTNNPADNINIKLSADGTITEGNSAQ